MNGTVGKRAGRFDLPLICLKGGNVYVGLAGKFVHKRSRNV